MYKLPIYDLDLYGRVDALSLILPTDKWYIYNFHIPKAEGSGLWSIVYFLVRKPRKNSATSAPGRWVTNKNMLTYKLN
jgi:hypothetical protein